MSLDEFPFTQVGSWLARGQMIPFLGAGASRAGPAGDVGLPDAAGLAGELVSLMEKAYPGSETDELAKVAQYFERTVFDRPALYEHLHRRFYMEQLAAPVARVAQLLADVPHDDHPLFAITTNYDTLIEQAFQAAGKPLCVIIQNMRDAEYGGKRVSVRLPDGRTISEDSGTFLWNDPRHHFPAGTTYLFKMHGSAHTNVDDGTDDLIITEDDYVDFLVNSGPVASFFPPVSLAAAYKARRFLFLGYSLQDWNFRAFLRLLAQRNTLSGRSMLRHLAIQLGPSRLDVELWKQRNVNVFDGSLAQFCDRLDAVWATGGAR